MLTQPVEPFGGMMGRPTNVQRIDQERRGSWVDFLNHVQGKEKIVKKTETRLTQAAYKQAKKAASEQFAQLCKDIVSVQPMDPQIMENLMRGGMTEKRLVQEGYEPVSCHRLLWIKTEDNK